MTTVDVDRELGGRYRLTERLHQGLGVETYRARDLDSGDDVVVKVAGEAALSTAARNRLEHEGLVLGRMEEHPHLVRLLDGGRDGEHVYLVTPWVPGRSLADRLASGPLSVAETITVARHVVAALRHAHDHGILHRDVKPANVIVDGDPAAGRPVTHAVLIDFGLARSELLDADVRDIPVGSVRYLAPEQAGLLPGGVDERSDLHAVGLVVAECLLGRPVFEGARVGDVLREQMTAVAPRLERPVPRVLDHIVARLLRRDPAERYQTAEALLHDLDLLARALDAGETEPSFVVGSRDRRETLAEPTFVGREAELATLEELVDRAGAGEGGTVVVAAESGAGKSRLLEELLRRVGDRVHRFHGQGLDQAAQRPFQVLSGVARDIVLASDDTGLPERLRERLGADAEAVVTAFPELAGVLGVERRPDGAVLGPEEFGEVRTVRALASLLDALGSSGDPALLVLDDCQWADELSCRLLARWNDTRSRPCHLLVVVAYRSDEIPVESALVRVEPLAEVTLPPLSNEDVAALAGSMAGELPASVLAVIARLAEGSPFMAAAVLRGLVEAGALVSRPDGWEVDEVALADASSSRRAATVLAHRIDLLGEETRRLLGVGAVLGKEFDVRVAAALAEVKTVDVGRAVREASRRHLVWSSADGRWSFVHDKIRETLLGLIDAAERRALHARTAALLEARSPTRFFDLAYHFDAAGQPERALPYALAAAEEARAQQSLEVVEQQYRIAERGASRSRETRGKVAEELGRVLMLRGRYGEAAAQFEQARSLAGDPRTLARIDGALGELAFKRGDMASSSEALERALRTLGQRVPRRAWLLFLVWEVLVQAVHTLAPRRTVGRRPLPDDEVPLLAARLYSRLAHTYWFQRGSVATLFVHLRGMNLAERYPPTAHRAQAYSEHAPIMSLLPWYARGVDYAERSHAIRRDLGDLWGQGQSRHFHGVVLYAASRWEEAAERCREAIRLLDRTGDRWEVNTARWHVAYCAYRRGDLRAAAEIAEQVWRDGTDLGDPQARGIGLSVWSKATAGQIPADAIAPEIDQLAEDVHTASEVLTAEAIRLLRAGSPAAAVAHLARADRLVRDAGLRQEYVAPVPCWLLTALRVEREGLADHVGLRTRRRRLRQARRVGRRARRLARWYRNNLPHALREAALVEAALGRHRRARRWLDRSVAVAEELGARQELARSRLARGEVGRVQRWPGADEDVAAGRGTLVELLAAVGGDEAASTPVTVSLADRFDQLLSAGRSIASSITARDTVDALADAAVSLLRPQDCLVLATPDFRRRPAPDDLRVVAGSGDEPSQSVVVEALSAEGVGSEAVVVHELLDADASDSLVLSGVRSTLCAPIRARGDVVGCLYVSHRDVGGVFGEDETRIAGFLTTLAGAALETAEGFAEIEALTRTLEQRVDDRTAALSDANRQLDERLSELGEAYEREQEIIERLRRLDQFKTELMAITAHDLRTPLSLIVGFATTLHDHADRLDDEQRATLLQRIAVNTRRLSEFVENLLQFTRIESGEVGLDVAPFDLGALLRRTVSEFEANEPDREFRLEVGDDLPPARGDEARQWQILMNLLSNAVKYSPAEAPVTVTARRAGDSSGDMIEVAVRDGGEGIPADELPKLFGKFSRLDGTDERRPTGTGLGLYICRSLVEAHGGTIRVDSTVGEGTTFTYTVPC